MSLEKGMRKIKIMYLVSTLKKSGPVNILYGIIKGLDKQKFDIFILSLSDEEKGSMLDTFKKFNLSLINLNHSRIKGIFKNRTAIQQLIDSYHIDITHSHGFRADLINSKLKNVIRFNTIHNFPGEDYLMQFGKSKGSIMEVTHKKAIQLIDFPVACSKTILKKFKSSYKINTLCIENGIVTSDFESSLKAKKEIRKTLNLPINKKIFIVSGSLISRKNPEFLIKTFKKFDNSETVLLFIGDGNGREKLSNKYKAENILFLGNVMNVKDYLEASDFYISASSSEGLPNSVLEAMHMGLPLILSTIPSHKEVIGSDYAYLFLNGNSDDLIKKLQNMVSSDHKNQIKLNRERVINCFDAQTMSERYQTKYVDQCQHLEK